jgi:hypothetical protein
MTTTELLEKYDNVSKEAYDNCIKGDWFHKAFRQVDICESPEMDMAIWQLLSVATLFWEMLPENVKDKS